MKLHSLQFCIFYRYLVVASNSAQPKSNLEEIDCQIVTISCTLPKDSGLCSDALMFRLTLPFNWHSVVVIIRHHRHQDTLFFFTCFYILNLRIILLWVDAICMHY